MFFILDNLLGMLRAAFGYIRMLKDLFTRKHPFNVHKAILKESYRYKNGRKFSKRKYAEIVDEKAKLDPRNRHKKKNKRPKTQQ